MRLVFAPLLVVLAAATPQRAAAPVAAASTAAGGFRLGSARAPVQLIEYASLTCPHCRAFHSEGWAALKRDYIAKGLVAIEVRNLALNGPDLVATVLARCDGAPAFFSRVDVFYDRQSVWLAPFGSLTSAQSDEIAKLPETDQLTALGRLGKLDAFAMGFGVTPAHYRQCTTDKAALARLDAIEKGGSALGVKGTPTFFLNGKQLPANTWAGIEPQIRLALKMKPRAG